MTNEEIAKKIQSGHNELYNELWKRVHKLMYKILRSKLLYISLPNYIDAEDLEQGMYFALCNAVQSYDSTKAYKFNSYLEYHIMNAIRSELPKKILCESSINQTVGDDEDNEIGDFIPDDLAEEKLKEIELTDIQMQTRQAISELPPNEREAVTLYYFKNYSYQQIGDIINISRDMARNRVNKGVMLLRRNKAIQSIYGEFERHYAGTEYILSRWETSKERQTVIDNLAQRQLNGEFIYYSTRQRELYLAKCKYIDEHIKSFS